MEGHAALAAPKSRNRGTKAGRVLWRINSGADSAALSKVYGFAFGTALGVGAVAGALIGAGAAAGGRANIGGGIVPGAMVDLAPDWADALGLSNRN